MTTQPEERDFHCQSSQNTEEPGGQTSRALGSTGLGTAFSSRPFPHRSHARDPSRCFLPLQQSHLPRSRAETGSLLLGQACGEEHRRLLLSLAL